MEKYRITVKNDIAKIDKYTYDENDITKTNWYTVSDKDVTAVRQVDLNDETVSGPHICTCCGKHVDEAMKARFITRYTAIFLCPDCVQAFIEGNLAIWD